MSQSRPVQPTRTALSALILLSMALLNACSGMPGASTPEPTQPVQDAVQAEEVSASGEVVPDKWASLSFSNGALNMDILVSVGEQVTEGQPLIASDDQQQRTALLQAQGQLAKAGLALDQLRDSPTGAALLAAEAALANAEWNYERLDDAGRSDRELEVAQAQIDSAKAALDELEEGPSEQQISAAEQDVATARAGVVQAEKAVADAILKAPFDGQVIEILANEFEIAAPQQPVLLLADLSSLRVETTDLSEVDAARIQVGDAARVVFDALPNLTVTGRVASIALKSSGGSAVYYRAVIALDEIPAGLRWGMTAFVVVP